jgi:hypothetical protein
VEANTSPSSSKRWGALKWVISGLVLLAVAAYIARATETWPFEEHTDRPHLSFPAGGPAEFLYLDNGRIVAYLAQIEGGTFASEERSSKVSKSAEGKVTLNQVLQAGVARSEENTVSRVVTPTAAAEYFELLFDLEHEPGPENSEGVDNVRLSYFHEDMEGLDEGQFVRFKTHGLRPPIYLNPYLAARQRVTMQALFPRSREKEAPGEVSRQRKRIRHFRRQLGRNPRVIFKLRPIYLGQLEAIENEHGEDGKSRTPPPTEESAKAFGASQQRKRCEKAPHPKLSPGESEPKSPTRRQAVYLMPIDARRLTRERSLMKYGGGTFTVVGKVVRIFPEDGNHQYPAYIDSYTRETWEQPLAHAPRKLLCRTEPTCRRLAVDSRFGKAERQIRRARCEDLAALRGQTEIPVRGAVILPIAIYK